MTNSYRTMLTELLEWAERTSSHYYKQADVIVRARALLAQPEPKDPTDEELTLTYAYAVAAAVGNKRGPYTTEDAEAAQLAGLRAVLAKWGHQ
jgi:CHASE2 domain-containing sensor protein